LEGSFIAYSKTGYSSAGSWDSSVDMAMGCSGRSGFDSREGEKIYFLLHSVQTGSGAYQASYPMGSNSSSSGRGVKLSYISPLSGAEVKKGGAILPLHNRFHVLMLN
jgi:hypothetical protein